MITVKTLIRRIHAMKPEEYVCIDKETAYAFYHNDKLEIKTTYQAYISSTRSFIGGSACNFDDYEEFTIAVKTWLREEYVRQIHWLGLKYHKDNGFTAWFKQTEGYRIYITTDNKIKPDDPFKRHIVTLTEEDGGSPIAVRKFSAWPNCRSFLEIVRDCEKDRNGRPLL